ncbi:N-acetylmuramoyl-L-alanine amidase [Actinokineospora alba]|uniref:N-acetylmuramoyl-L-alanine amidase n=1 Tax=Actinokineospora alba TaxID=504798 RepID=UPI001414DD4B|nr:N-acetylmuramoyl-L-alanine amidase [Actinokineospora alba]
MVTIPGANAAQPTRAPKLPSIQTADLPASPPVKAKAATLAAKSGKTTAPGVREVAPDGGFSMVGLKWSGAAPEVMEVRWRTDGTWSDWQENEPAEGGRDGKPVVTTEPIWTGRADRVQVRATRAGADATDALTVVAVDPGESPNDSLIASVNAVPDRPTLVTRAQWGADESIMNWTPEYVDDIKGVTIHHTAQTNNYTCADSAAMVRSVYQFHTVAQGYGDIGYNVLVDKCGIFFEGRSGGQRYPVVAGHAYGFNRHTFGISIIGDHTTTPPTDVTLESVATMAAWKMGNGYIDPAGTITLTSGAGTDKAKYPIGKQATLPKIFGHRDVVFTECPGTTAYNKLDTIRARVTALMGDWQASPIHQKWQALGTTSIGPVYGVEQSEAGGGRSTEFKQGVSTIAYRSDVGAHLVSGAINAKFRELGGFAKLGYPTNDESGTTDGQGRFNHFTGNASIYYTPTTGAHAVLGPIRDTWNSLGAEKSFLGYPTTDEETIDGGRRANFQGGTVLISNSTGKITIYRKYTGTTAVRR